MPEPKITVTAFCIVMALLTAFFMGTGLVLTHWFGWWSHTWIFFAAFPTVAFAGVLAASVWRNQS